MSESRRSAPPETAATLEHQPGFRVRRGINWLLLGLTYGSFYMCRYNIAIASTRIRSEFGFSREQFGTISSGRDWAYALGQFINGLLTDRMGGKQAMFLGAMLTVAMNVVFGMASFAGAGSVLMLFILIRTCDGYAQAFGAPGMIKVNTAWFPRRERGRFAGVFGLMIQLGQITINTFGPLLLAGCTVPLLVVSLRLPAMHWRWLFWIPPAVVAVVATLMFLLVRNDPEQAGYTVEHDAREAATDAAAGERISLGQVFRTIAGKPMVWITAGAYFCTGVVRTAQNNWTVMYFDEVWHLDVARSTLVIITMALLPIMAFLGSIISGFISDLLFKGRRAPVAVALYAIQAAVTVAAIVLLNHRSYAGPSLAAVLLLAISITCNATHSILGTAAAMDLGGRKMAGFASGVIDSFQYIGGGIAGWGLGRLLDYSVKHHPAFGWNVWFVAMLPPSLIGMVLMAFVWHRSRGRDVVAG